jgi:uncharacterized repeat protein (TIGR03803 family)
MWQGKDNSSQALLDKENRMVPSRQHRTSIFGTMRSAVAVPGLAILFALSVFVTPVAQAQTYSIIHPYTGGGDGATPLAGLTIDHAGNLWGTTSAGGLGYGTVFKLTNAGSGWRLIPLYSFQSGTDGATPTARVIFGPDGSLYGTTSQGGNTSTCGYHGCGTVFNLKPSATRASSVFRPWTETVLRTFNLWDGGGAYPSGEVVFDRAGNLYGTAIFGGGILEGFPDCNRAPCGTCDPACGTVFELSPSNGGWTYSRVYHFTSWDYTGAEPESPLVFDRAGNLYGTTSIGDVCGFGNLFELTPGSSGWTGQILHTFCGYQGDGAEPLAGLVPDSSGNNFYGATPGARAGWGTQLGSIYLLTPSGSGGWNFTVILNFPYGAGPGANLVMDADGNLYGTTTYGGNSICPYGCGTVFKMTPSGTLTDLHDFTGDDGKYPYSNLVFDASGNLYGTTSAGGPYGFGVVFKVAP